MSRSRQRGFIPGTVIEINVSLALLGIAVAVLWTWSTMKYHPVNMESFKAVVVAPAAATVAAPAGWTVKQAEGGTTVIQRGEPAWQTLIVPVLLVLTVISIFVAPLSWPYWTMLVVLCGAWGYGATLGPGNQNMRVAQDGSVALVGMARFALLVAKTQAVPAKDVEAVLVHKQQPEAYLVFRVGDVRRGWRIYADTPADAHAVAALVQSKLKPPPAPAAKPEPA